MHSLELTLRDSDAIKSIILGSKCPSWLSSENERVRNQEEISLLCTKVWRAKEANYWEKLVYRRILRDAAANRTKEILEGDASLEDPYSKAVVNMANESAQRASLARKAIDASYAMFNDYKESCNIDTGPIEKQIKDAMVQRILDQIRLRENLLSREDQSSPINADLIKEEISSGLGLLREVYGVDDAKNQLSD